MAQFKGVVAKAQPTAVADEAAAALRLSKYGEPILQKFTQAMYSTAEEGNYYKATLPLGTAAIALGGATQTAFVATTPTIVIRNTGGANANKTIYLDYIRINVTTIGGGTVTSAQVGMVTDAVLRYTSGGTVLTASNVNTASPTTTAALIHAGAITAPAAGFDLRTGARSVLKTGVLVAGDSFMLNTGAADLTSPLPAASPGCSSLGPVVLGPVTKLNSALFYLWFPGLATTAPTGDFEIAWWER